MKKKISSIKRKKKVLIASRYYNVKDKYITNYIIEILTKYNIIPIYSNILNSKTAQFFYDFFSEEEYPEYSKEMLGGICYYSNQVDGIIYISIAKCHVDAILNNLSAIKNSHLSSLNISIDYPIDKAIIKEKITNFIKTIECDQDAN